MPQPIHRIVPDLSSTDLYFDANILADKPDMAFLVTKIFASWGRIEFELSLLLSQILKADAGPALAIHSVLTAQHLQLLALEAVAKEALPNEDFEVFQSVMAVTDAAQAPRNQLAHWIWGGCKRRTDLLVLFDPRRLKTRQIEGAKYIYQQEKTGQPINSLYLWNLTRYEHGHVLAYSKGDLERAERNLNEASDSMFELKRYLNPESLLPLLQALDPTATLWGIRGEALRALNGKRLFREAVDRLRKDQQK